MIKKRFGKPQRLDDEFEKLMRETMFERASKGLAKKNMRDMSVAEATFLLRTTPSFPLALQELKSLPKRRRK